MNVVKTFFGTLSSGEEIYKYTLKNRNGFEVSIINYGAIITAIRVPDRNGSLSDIVLGFDNLADYTSEEYIENNPYFGAAVGRYSNRISNGKLELNGKVISLKVNEGQNSLHGGPEGFDKRVWGVVEFKDAECSGLVLKLNSPDGDQGYPGNLEVELIYTITGKNELVIEYSAVSDKDTVCSLTNHSYFNLMGEGKGDIGGHRLCINSVRYLEIDDDLIPTGRVLDVKGTSLDFSVMIDLSGATGKKGSRHDSDKYSHAYFLDKDENKQCFAARLEEPVSGRIMEVFTTEPSILFYNGYGLDGRFTGKSGKRYLRNAGLCLETQQLPDAPNHRNFYPSILPAGKKYKSRTEYRFSVDREK